MGATIEEREGQLIYLGHSENDDGRGPVELLRHHILAVAGRAEQFGEAFGVGEQAKIAGLLHDIGKYADQFQDRVRGIGAGRDHSSAGALVVARLYRQLGIIPAMAIAAHHIGLEAFQPDHKKFTSALGEVFRDKTLASRLTTADVPLLQKRLEADGIVLPKLKFGLLPTDTFPAADLLDVRMLFSCLVDADFLETEAHFDGDALTPRRPRPDGQTLYLDKAIDALNKHVAAFKPPTNEIQRARQSLFQSCVDAAALATGQFTLTAPTGTGKTLAMLAFALHHAQQHNLRRIVLVMPFLNIIEQTAGIYRMLFSETSGFPPNTVLEHHSLVREAQSSADDLEEVSTRKPFHQLLAENWDAPIILTTSVQFLESMMSNRTTACRKLHRLAKSVVLFDEVQTLPSKLAKATLATLSRLSDPAGPYGSTILFATATQPAFDVLHDQVGHLCSAGWQPREINANAPAMFTIAGKRIRTRWKHNTSISVNALARDIVTHEQVLCIVNLKRHAAELTDAVNTQCDPETVLHLSTNMCPAHRIKVLEAIRARLRDRLPVRLISTQCVEAGVDLDFPAVYRALAPIDAICQAAGRCNRHGDHDSPGVVTVFQFDDDGKVQFPPGYSQAINATLTWLNAISNERKLDATELLNDPNHLRAYFRTLYGSTGRQNAVVNDERDLHDAIRQGRFDTVAQEYKLIESDTVSVLVPYDVKVFAQLRDEAHYGFADAYARRKWRERASVHAVSIYRNDNSPIWPHLEAVKFYKGVEATNAESDWFIALEGLRYDKLAGLIVPDPADLIA